MSIFVALVALQKKSNTGPVFLSVVSCMSFMCFMYFFLWSHVLLSVVSCTSFTGFMYLNYSDVLHVWLLACTCFIPTLSLALFLLRFVYILYHINSWGLLPLLPTATIDIFDSTFFLVFLSIC